MPSLLDEPAKSPPPQFVLDDYGVTSPGAVCRSEKPQPKTDKEADSRPVTKTKVGVVHDAEAQQKADSAGINAGSNALPQQDDFEYGIKLTDEVLNEAVAVYDFTSEEFENDVYIPAAVEFDPDCKMNKKLRKRVKPFMYACIVVVIMVIVAIVGAAVATLVSSNEQKQDEKALRSTLGIRKTVESLVGQDNLKVAHGPYGLALDWITYTDPMEILPDDPHFVQRYIAAYMYYATSMDRGWAYCAPPREKDTDRCIFREALPGDYNEKGDYSRRIPGFRWLSAPHTCKWVGVSCNTAQQIEEIHLNGMGMTGVFPQGVLNHFPHLTDLTIGVGELRGPLPPSVKGLKRLWLNQNAFTGTIPTDWYASDLEDVDLRGNGLVGSLSSRIGESAIKVLQLSDNRLTGTLPGELGDLVDATRIRLEFNHFTGQIPTTLGKFNFLQLLRLDNNALTGSIPSELSSGLIVELYLGWNSLSGELPGAIYDGAAHFEFLELAHNHLTGTISSKIGQLTELRRLRLDNNRFSGTIPSELGNLSNLMTVSFSGNAISGEVPLTLCDMTGEEYFDTLKANCRSDEEGVLPEVACDCCSVCCDANGKECLPNEEYFGRL